MHASMRRYPAASSAETYPGQFGIKAGCRRKRAMTCIHVTAADPTHLEIALDLTQLIDVLNEAMPAASPLTDQQLAFARDMADMVSDVLYVDTTLTVDQVRRDFLAGVLTSHLRKSPPCPLARRWIAPIHPTTRP